MKACADPTCPDPATYRGRCQRHARERDRSIPRAGRDIYNSKRWALTRRAKLDLNPICERCESLLATDAHHIVDIKDGGNPWAMSNLESLCHVCHSKETRARQ